MIQLYTAAGKQDLWTELVRMSLQKAQQREVDLVTGATEVQRSIRHLETLISHYKIQVQELQQGRQSLDLVIRMRSSQASCTYQTVIEDLTSELHALQSAQSKISAALGS